MKVFAAIVTAVLVTTGASAGEIDQPYRVTVDGIELSETLGEGEEVNVKADQGDRGINTEIEGKPYNYLGDVLFIPWDNLGYDTASLCVSWVQVNGYNYHFGESGEEPIGYGCGSSPDPSPTGPACGPEGSCGEVPTYVTPTPTPTPETTVTEGACTDDWDGTYRQIEITGDEWLFLDSHRDDCVRVDNETVTTPEPVPTEEPERVESNTAKPAQPVPATNDQMTMTG